MPSLALGIGLHAGLAQADETITIAYQTGFSPFVRAVASGEIQKIPGVQVEFRQFNSGAEIFAAIASGDVQIGDVGSSPFAASTSKGIDVKAIYISGAAGEDEALVARNGSGIEKLEDLKGKRLAAAPVSTDHFMLLSTLKQLGIKPDEATVLAIPQPEIVAAWQRGDIDAAFVWDPALGKLLESGKRLLTAKEAAERGAVTFGALVATADVIKDQPEFLQNFVGIVDKYYRDLAQNPGSWTPESENVQALAKFSGAKAGGHRGSHRRLGLCAGERTGERQLAGRRQGQQAGPGAARHRRVPQGAAEDHHGARRLLGLHRPAFRLGNPRLQLGARSWHSRSSTAA